MDRLHKAKNDVRWVRWAAVCFGFTMACCADASAGHLQPLARLGTPVTVLPGAPDSKHDQSGVPLAPLNRIDLSVALRLAGVENPTINLAEERIREARAGQVAARALLIPSV